MEESKLECRIGTPIPETREAAPKYYRLPPLTEDEVRCLKEALDSRQRSIRRLSLRAIKRMTEEITDPSSINACAYLLTTYVKDAGIVGDLRLMLENSLKEVSDEEAAEGA